MKKTLALVLALIMTFSLSVTAFAALPTLTFTTTASGASYNSTDKVYELENVKTGDIITVYYKLQSSGDTKVSTMGDEIYYDHSFFQLVSGSNTVIRSGFATSSPTYLSGDTYVFFNTVNTQSYTGNTSYDIGSFQLKVIATSGNSTIANRQCKAYQTSSSQFTISTQNLRVYIGTKATAKYKVTMKSASADDVVTEVNAGTSITLTTPTREFYTFGGWKMDGDDTVYLGGVSYTPTSNVTFTAVWVAVPAPAAPTGLTTTNATGAAKKDGVIKGTTALMEYSTTSDFKNAKTCGAGETTGLAPGTYFIRLKAVGTTTPAGEYTAVAVLYDQPIAGDDDDDDDEEPEPERPSKEEVVADVDGCDMAEECPTDPYVDLDDDDWYHDGIHYCIEMGYMDGTGTNTFEPETATTRAMIVTVLWRIEGEPEVEDTTTFKDVKSGSWYSTAVAWASQNKIVEGYSSTQFGPEDEITREQFATILFRYANYKGYDTSHVGDIDSFVDAEHVSSYAEAAMIWANGAGLMNGREGNAIAPKGSAKRSEAATLIYRFDTLIAD